jgi:hypothetical protein
MSGKKIERQTHLHRMVHTRAIILFALSILLSVAFLEIATKFSCSAHASGARLSL